MEVLHGPAAPRIGFYLLPSAGRINRLAFPLPTVPSQAGLRVPGATRACPKYVRMTPCLDQRVPVDDFAEDSEVDGLGDARANRVAIAACWPRGRAQDPGLRRVIEGSFEVLNDADRCRIRSTVRSDDR